MEDLLEPVPCEQDLGSAPIGRLFASYSLTTFVGYLAQIVMVILEGLIIGNGLGAEGLACVTVVLPLELLNLALGGALGQGTASLAGERRGAGDAEGAQKVFEQGFWLTAVGVGALSLLMWAFAPQVAVLLGATGDLVGEIAGFIRNLMPLYPFCSLGQLLLAMLRVDEKPNVASAVSVAASCAALAVLYTVVYVLGLGFSATGFYFGTSTALWFLSILYVNGSRRSGFRVTLRGARLESRTCAAILRRGVPLFGVQAASLVYTTVINNYLGALGGDGDLAAFSVVNGYVIYLLDMACLSSTMGLSPIASFNHGAGQTKRLRQLVVVSMVGTGAVLAVACAAIVAGAEPIARFFLGADAADPALLTLTTSHFLPMLVCAPLGFLAQVASSYLQAVGEEAPAAVLSVCRYLLFAVPLIVGLSVPFGVNGVWWAQPIADTLAAVLSVALLARSLR